MQISIRLLNSVYKQLKAFFKTMDNLFSFLSDLIKSGSVSEFQTIFVVFIVLFIFRKNILKQVFESDQNQEPQKSDDTQNQILEKLDNIQSKIETIKEQLVADDARINRLENSLNNITLQIKSELLDFKKDFIK